jgi:hypothetical protein
MAVRLWPAAAADVYFIHTAYIERSCLLCNVFETNSSSMNAFFECTIHGMYTL